MMFVFLSIGRALYVIKQISFPLNEQPFERANKHSCVVLKFQSRFGLQLNQWELVIFNEFIPKQLTLRNLITKLAS